MAPTPMYVSTEMIARGAKALYDNRSNRNGQEFRPWERLSEAAQLRYEHRFREALRAAFARPLIVAHAVIDADPWDGFPGDPRSVPCI